MMTRFASAALCFVVLCILGANSAEAQAPRTTTKPPANPANTGRAIKITEQVRPAYIIDPIVNRIDSRRGKTLSVEFGITCEGAPSTLEIRTVALTQDENGTIFPNDKVPAPKDLELLTPGTVQLQPEEKFVIKGRLRVPDTLSTFHTFGILVRDSGQLKEQANDQKADGPRVGIRFVTQYLLRCDVTVQGVRSLDASKLVVEGGELVEVNGIPVARVFVSNPTEGPIEFGLRSQIRLSQEGEEQSTFPLGMPVRVNLEEPEKYIGRILAGARIRMESPLPTPIFPGQYYLETSLIGDRSVLAKTGFPLLVANGDFPAQGLASVQVAPGVIASPSQIELSMQRGGSRIQVLSFQNNNSAAVEIEVRPEGVDGQPIEWLAIRPGSMTLPAGATRKMSVTLGGLDDALPHRFARLKIKSTVAGTPSVESSPVVVALLGRSDAQPVIESDDVAWDIQHGPPAFVVNVKNTGERHFPLEAMLTLGDESGRPIDIRGGFGKWILPGASEQLRFKPPRSLPAGKYSAILRIPTGEGNEPIEKRLEFDLTGVSP